MKVDKARSYRQPRAVDAQPGLSRCHLPDLGDRVTADGDIGDKRRRAASVDDPSLLNEQIPHRLHPFALRYGPLGVLYNFRARSAQALLADRLEDRTAMSSARQRWRARQFVTLRGGSQAKALPNHPS
jgi:hypothetical protein